MTFSIVARGDDGLLGVASASRALAVGARCPHVAPGLAAIATQAYTNPYLALDAISRMRAGEALDAAITGALDADEGREWRQLVAIAPDGWPFAFTGGEAEAYAGKVFGTDCAAAGNVLTGSGVLEAAVYAFENFTDRPFPERLLGALLAGQSAGGDRRGRQSAALLIRAQEEVAFIDLRVDDHSDPIAELGRLVGLMRAPDRDRARWFATTRRPRPISELRSAQERTRAELSGGR